MDSVIERLADIEMTAENIVAHAEAQKSEIEKRIQNQRDEFDQTLALQTEKELAGTKAEADRRMTRILEEEKQRHHSVIDHLEKDYEENHEAYAQEILEHIIAV